MLTLHNVIKTFKSSAILNNMSFSVKAGSIVGIAGPSGIGKSVLLRCIEGLEKIDSGTIQCPRKRGFIFQDFQLFPHMTVYENIAYQPLYVEKKPKHLVKETVESLLDELDITQQQHSYPNRISGGQKQRVALARTLAIEPQLLLCDEPTSGLDISTTRNVSSLIRNINQSHMITMVIASHDIDFLVDTADRILIMEKGKIGHDLIATKNDTQYKDNLQKCLEQVTNSKLLK